MYVLYHDSMEMYQSCIKIEYLIAIFLQVFKYFLNNTADAKRTGLLISPLVKEMLTPCEQYVILINNEHA